MKKIRNPYVGIWKEGYHCFGCSPKNEIGLQLQFYDTGNEIISKWQPRMLLEGYPDVVHGGIQSTIMDEAGGWVVCVKCETSGVTTNMNISFLRPLRVSAGEVTVKAYLVEKKEKEALIKTELFDGYGKLCAEGVITYYIYPQEIAKRKLKYPGVEAFYE